MFSSVAPPVTRSCTVMPAYAGEYLPYGGGGRGARLRDVAVREPSGCLVVGNVHPRADEARPSIRRRRVPADRARASGVGSVDPPASEPKL